MPKKTRFVDLLGSYEKEIHRYAFRMTGNYEDASDVLQETFLHVWERGDRYRPERASARGWTLRQSFSLR